MTTDISLSNLIKEKEECDKGCGMKFNEMIGHNLQKLWECGGQKDMFDESIELCSCCKATSLALSKGIEVAQYWKSKYEDFQKSNLSINLTNQKKMFEELIDKMREKLPYILCYGLKGNHIKEEKCFEKMFIELYEKELKSKLAEQLEVKE